MTCLSDSAQSEHLCQISEGTVSELHVQHLPLPPEYRIADGEIKIQTKH
jgi:hypothetical protein